MGVQLGKAGDVVLGRSRSVVTTKEKSKSNQEILLCLALIVLMAWAFLFSVRTVDWGSIGHAFKDLLAVI